MGKVYICGDFNARCGNNKDITDCYLHVHDRLVCDHETNKQGINFIEFLEEIEFCMLNGRFGPNSNKFTSVSYRGLAVVDYCITSISNFNDITTFEVLLVQDMLDEYNIQVDGSIPDHSILY